MKIMCKFKIICISMILFLVQSLFSCASSEERNLQNRAIENFKIIKLLLEKERQQGKDIKDIAKLLEESHHLIKEKSWVEANKQLNHILYMFNTRHSKSQKIAFTKLRLIRNMVELRVSEGKDIKEILPLMERAIHLLKNQFEFEEASNILDRILSVLREGKPEEERRELTPFTPDTVQRMFRKVKLLIEIREMEGEDMTPIKQVAQETLKLAVQKRDIKGTFFSLRKILDNLESRVDSESIEMTGQKAENTVKELNEEFFKEFRLKSPSNDEYMKSGFYHWAMAKIYYDNNQLNLASKEMKSALNQIKKSSPANINDLPPQKLKTETENFQKNPGKVVPPDNKGAYIGYWGDPYVGEKNGFYKNTNSHAAIIYDDATWYNYRDNYYAFNNLFDFNESIFIRESFSKGINPLIANFEGMADIYFQHRSIFALAWTPGLGGYGEYSEYFRYKKAPHLDDIINGGWDPYIINMAQEIKKWGKPVMLELHYEFNADTQTTGGPNAFGPDGETNFFDICNPDLVYEKFLHPEIISRMFLADTQKSLSDPTYIIYDCDDLYDKYGSHQIPDGPERARDMLRHVHDVFDQLDVTNVTWFAHSIGNYGSPSDRKAHLWNKLDYYWPGDNYIDWVGTSAYYTSVKDDPLEIDIVKDTGTFHAAVSWFYKLYNNSKWKNKPVMLVEFGYKGEGGQQETIKKIFGDYLINEFPAIKGVIFGNREPPRHFGAYPGEKEVWEKYINTNSYYAQYLQFNADYTAPGKISDFKADVHEKDIIFTWTAPGDDGYNGTVSYYIIKYRENPQDYSGGGKKDFTKEPWTLWSRYETKDIEGEPKPVQEGKPQKMILSGFPKGTYYFGIQSVDDVPYNSQISNIVKVIIK